MSRKDDLEKNINEAYQLVREYEIIRGDTDDPRKKRRAERAIKEQWELIRGYLAEYIPLCQRLGLNMAQDIIEIAAATQFPISETLSAPPTPADSFFTDTDERTTRPTVFVSYSHKDEKEKDALVAHLGVLDSADLIDLWSDDRINAGADWEAEIRLAIAKAQVAILLISANFLTSQFILRREVPEFLKRRDQEGLTVFPVIAKACAWKKVEWLAKMNVRPKNGQPVWSDGGSHVDIDLAAIAEEVAKILSRGKHI